MSALPPKADITESDRHVRFVPIANISSCKVYTFRSLNCSLVHAIWPLV
jgi:hypothetical protein